MKSALDELRANRIVILDGFVSATRCEGILDELDFAYWTPSTVVRATEAGSTTIGRSPRRVSETTGEEWFGPELQREVRNIETRLCRRLGLDRTHLEPWQATRYRYGGRFDAHFDGGPFRHEPAGDREVTLLVYLTTPDAGGSTTFPELGLDVAPRAGTAVAWANLTADGSVDPNMKHRARPVRKGRKVTLTTWSRQRAVRAPNRADGREKRWQATSRS